MVLQPQVALPRGDPQRLVRVQVDVHDPLPIEHEDDASPGAGDLHVVPRPRRPGQVPGRGDGVVDRAGGRPGSAACRGRPGSGTYPVVGRAPSSRLRAKTPRSRTDLIAVAAQSARSPWPAPTASVLRSKRGRNRTRHIRIGGATRSRPGGEGRPGRARAAGGPGRLRPGRVPGAQEGEDGGYRRLGEERLPDQRRRKGAAPAPAEAAPTAATALGQGRVVDHVGEEWRHLHLAPRPEGGGGVVGDALDAAATRRAAGGPGPHQARRRPARPGGRGGPATLDGADVDGDGLPGSVSGWPASAGPGSRGGGDDGVDALLGGGLRASSPSTSRSEVIPVMITPGRTPPCPPGTPEACSASTASMAGSSSTPASPAPLRRPEVRCKALLGRLEEELYRPLQRSRRRASACATPSPIATWPSWRQTWRAQDGGAVGRVLGSRPRWAGRPCPPGWPRRARSRPAPSPQQAQHTGGPAHPPARLRPSGAARRRPAPPSPAPGTRAPAGRAARRRLHHAPGALGHPRPKRRRPARRTRQSPCPRLTRRSRTLPAPVRRAPRRAPAARSSAASAAIAATVAERPVLPSQKSFSFAVASAVSSK